MKSAATMSKVDMIQASLRCYVIGCFSLLPLIGLLFGIMAIALSYRLRRQGFAWNAGEEAIKRGVSNACWGVALSLVEILLIACLALS